MIKKHSDDPDVAHAAKQALKLIQTTLASLPKAEGFDYGGHMLKLGEYDVCVRCTAPIAEAQAAQQALVDESEKTTDETIKEHLELAAELFRLEAEAAVVRAEFHNGHGTENILNQLLAFKYERGIDEDYQHSHHQGAEV
jgi:hypothetical protein